MPHFKRELDPDGPLTARNFEARVCPLRPALLNIARKKLLPDDAQDAVQQVLIAAYDSMQRFDPATGQAGLMRWLARLLNYKVIDRLRDLARYPTEELPPDFELDAEENEEGEVEEAMLQQTLRLLDELDLSPMQRRCLSEWLSGRKQIAIARDLGISQTTVSYHVRVARRLFEERIGQIVVSESVSESARLMFAEACRVTRYRRPVAVWDRKGNAAQREKRRYRDLPHNPQSVGLRTRRWYQSGRGNQKNELTD